MNRDMLRAVIHSGTVTQANLHYVGSVTVDLNLLDAADILPGEMVAIADITNGTRLETYVIAGERGSGVIGINGAAAHLVDVGDKIELSSYASVRLDQASSLVPIVVYVDDHNAVLQVSVGAFLQSMSAPQALTPHTSRIGGRRKPRELAWSGPFPD